MKRQLEARIVCGVGGLLVTAFALVVVVPPCVLIALVGGIWEALEKASATLLYELLELRDRLWAFARDERPGEFS